MNKLLCAAAALSIVSLTSPASAVTFPSLTTIYVGTGVNDDAETATSFHCSNVSGVSTDVRFLVLSASGVVEGLATVTIAHGATHTASTRNTAAYIENTGLATGTIVQGLVNIESRQSGVFCSAMSIDIAATSPLGVTLPLVRVNPHPGTVE